jgi:dihydrofolate reductase
MANFVYIATSLDGFIARKDGNIDWLNDIPNPTQSDYGYYAFIDRIDAMLIGRMTYETVLSFNVWPYTKPVFVLSRTLTGPLIGGAELLCKTPGEATAYLNDRGYKNLYVDGGVTIQGFLREDLIDEMIITRVPIVLGSGLPLFGESGLEIQFRHVETVVYDDLLVKSRYIREPRKGGQ